MTGRVTELASCPEINEIADLKLRNDIAYRSVLFELKVPFDTLPFPVSELRDGNVKVAIAWNISTPGKVKRQAQFSVPKNFKWNDPSSFSTLILDGEAK